MKQIVCNFFLKGLVLFEQNLEKFKVKGAFKNSEVVVIGNQEEMIGGLNCGLVSLQERVRDEDSWGMFFWDKNKF